MLKSIVLNKHAHRRCLSYFSSAFNNVAHQGPPKSASESATTGASSLDLDIFINPENKPMDFLDKLEKLRKQKECTKVPLLPNILVQQVLEHSNPQETIGVLRNPLQYGVFIDQFTGCHFIDVLLNNGHAREAAQVSAMLLERELCNNELVTALSIKSFYVFLKNFEPKHVEQVEESTEVEKVRVKFIRNYPESEKKKTEEQILGEAIIKLAAKPDNLKELGQNISLLGYVLCARFEEAEKYIADNKNILYKDILQVCRNVADNDFFKEQITAEFSSQLEAALKECTKASSFEAAVDARVKESATKLEPQLIADYTKSYQEWETKFQSSVKDQNRVLDVQNRMENIESTLSGLQTMRQNLWYFENKEDIDIQIFKKKVSYPKRWFGKKKKPKTVDAFYVPPTISRGN